MSRDRLPLDQVLADLPAWHRADDPRDAVARRLVFADFSTAWAFMSRVALKAEQLDHHPEWSNVYNRVEVVLTTHDAGGVSALDVALGRFIDKAASELGAD